MPGLLGRSKSFRILRKGGHDGLHPRETDKITPQAALSQVDVRRLKEPSLPTSGQSLETPEMLQRPQTSAGTGDRPPPFHKKVRPSGQHDNNSFEFSPLSPAKSTAVLYAAEVYESTEGIIGIALGSPTTASHWNVASTVGPESTSDTRDTVTHTSPKNKTTDQYAPSIAAESQHNAPKSKMSRWKSLFKKSGPPPRLQEKEPFYQLAATKPIPSPRADSHHDDEVHEDDSAVQSPAYSYNPSIRESRKLPKGQAQPAVDTRPRALTLNSAPPKPKTSLLRSASNAISPRFPKKPPSLPPVPTSNELPSSSLLTLPGAKPVLDITIPEVRMERYSVMFSDLLQNGGDDSTSKTSSSPVQQNTNSSPSSATSSSLLQRRQADHLKPLDRLSIKNPSQSSSVKPQRRATSPHQLKSPSAALSLFPSPDVSRAPSPRPRDPHTSMHRPRPLRRSRTEPITLAPQAPSIHSDDSDATIGLAITPETPQDAVTPLTSTSMASSRNSFESLHGGEELSVKPTNSPAFKPTLPIEKEPEWEILPKRAPSKITKNDALRSHPSVREPTSPPADIIATASPVTLIRSPSSARLQKTSSPSPSARLAAKASASSSSSGTATTVGVARSVSVSRTKKSPLLTPGSAGSMDARMVDNRALTPTLVELKNRRSVRVQLVDA